MAAAFAVALALLVSVSSTAQAQAAPDHTIASTANSVGNVAPGDTVRIEVASAFAQVSITGSADGVGGSFDANDGQSISCGDGNACDEDPDANEVAVDLTVDADSGEGHILLSVGGLGATTATKVINVNKSTLVGSLSLTAVSKTIAASDDPDTAGTTENETSLVVNVKNAATTPAGLNTQSVTLLTTLGTISCDGTNYAQACSVSTTDSASTPGVDTDGVPGYATVTLRGGGVEGVATITATLGSLSKTVDVTMFGSAKNLTAEPMQGSIEIGGDVYVVLTVTDGAGNPVSGQVIAPIETGATKEVVGPADDAVLVVTEKNTAEETGVSVAGVGYSKDLINATDSTKSIPACGDDNTGSSDGTTDDAFGPGTNADGKCVVHVTAPKKGVAGADENATRGLHTLSFAIGTIRTSAEIEVAGSPSSITTDAPAQVDPGSVTEITVSVWDDDEVLVGITSVKVRKVDGGGLIEDEGEGGSEMTSNGQSKFTFIAPSSVGSSEILITAGDVNERVTIMIGEPAPEPEPTPEPPAAPASVSLVLDGDGLLVITAPDAPEGATAEQQLRAGTGEFRDAASVTAEAGMTYTARVRFVDGDLASDWAYSNSVTIPQPPPPPPEPEISVSGQSGSIGVLNAGSLEDLLGALDCGGNAGTTVTIDGNTYVVGAPDVVNSAFLANVAFPIDFGGAYVNCR